VLVSSLSAFGVDTRVGAVPLTRINANRQGGSNRAPDSNPRYADVFDQ